MKNPQKLLVILLASISILATGCGGPGTPNYGAPTSYPYFLIQTTNTSTGGGSGEEWGNVQVTGYASPTTVTCDPSSDQYCIPNVGDVGTGNGALTQNNIPAFYTDGSGQANFYTDAQSAIWTFYGDGAITSNCSSTLASFITLQDSVDGSIVALQCGSNPAAMLSTPSSCAPGACPSTVTLSYPPPSTGSLPLNTELTAAVYNNAGANVGQSNEQASTTTSVVVPTPTTWGTTAIAVYNPAGSLVGVSEFSIKSPLETCSQQSMPYGDGSGVVTTCLQVTPGLVEGDVDVIYDNGNYNGYVSGIITLTDQTAGIQLGTNSDIKDYGEADADFQQVGNLVEGHTYQACGSGYIGINGPKTKVCVSVIYSE